MSACCASPQLAGCLTGWLAEVVCWCQRRRLPEPESGGGCCNMACRHVNLKCSSHTLHQPHAGAMSPAAPACDCGLLQATLGCSKLAETSSCCLFKPFPQLRQQQHPCQTPSRPPAAGYTGRQPRPGQVRGTPAQQDPSHLVNINDLDTPRPATTGIPGYGGHQLPAELAMRGEATCGG